MTKTGLLNEIEKQEEAETQRYIFINRIFNNLLIFLQNLLKFYKWKIKKIKMMKLKKYILNKISINKKYIDQI